MYRKTVKEKFGDGGADTFGHIVDSFPNLQIPNLVQLGLVKAANAASGGCRYLEADGKNASMPAKYGHCREISLAKDTTSGHWEMAGVPVVEPWGYFKPDYPAVRPGYPVFWVIKRPRVR